MCAEEEPVQFNDKSTRSASRSPALQVDRSIGYVDPPCRRRGGLLRALHRERREVQSSVALFGPVSLEIRQRFVMRTIHPRGRTASGDGAFLSQIHCALARSPSPTISPCPSFNRAGN